MDLLVRNLPELTAIALRAQARRNGHSMAAEVRAVLEQHMRSRSLAKDAEDLRGELRAAEIHIEEPPV